LVVVEVVLVDIAVVQAVEVAVVVGVRWLEKYFLLNL